MRNMLAWLYRGSIERRLDRIEKAITQCEWRLHWIMDQTRASRRTETMVLQEQLDRLREKIAANKSAADATGLSELSRKLD